MSRSRNEFLTHGSSDESDNESDVGYDSEAGEISKAGKSASTDSTRARKRRKLEHPSSGEDEDSDRETSGDEDETSEYDPKRKTYVPPTTTADRTHEESRKTTEKLTHDQSYSTQRPTSLPQIQTIPNPIQPSKPSSSSRPKSKPTRPGVIYLSSLPPYLKPSALRNLLLQRGFGPITRLFLTPSSKTKSKSKSSRQLYSEGWIEFSSHKVARRCAETLNAAPVGGKKGGFYHDDLWNMKYLKGMGWEELMAGIREERREEEGRRDEERRVIAAETKRFVEGVERGRREGGMRRKRQKKEGGEDGREDDDEVKRTWRQFEVKTNEDSARRKSGEERISEDVRQVLGKIF